MSQYTQTQMQLIVKDHVGLCDFIPVPTAGQNGTVNTFLLVLVYKML